MYNRSAIIYDAIYRAQGKDYAAEAQKINMLIVRQYKRYNGRSLLDVACGQVIISLICGRILM